MQRRLYPESEHPRGHPLAARNLKELALFLKARGKSGEWRKDYEEALAMNRRLYPAGQTALAASPGRLGTLFFERGGSADVPPASFSVHATEQCLGASSARRHLQEASSVSNASSFRARRVTLPSRVTAATGSLIRLGRLLPDRANEIE